MASDTDELMERVQLAREDISRLSESMLEFEKTSIETRRVYPIQLGAPFIIEARIKKPIPVYFRVKAGSIINELRVILDNLASILASRNGYAGSSTVYFPISADAETFQTDGTQKMRRLAQEDQNIIADLKPYNGGDNILFSLHKLDVTRKHLRLFQNVPVIGPMRYQMSDSCTDINPDGGVTVYSAKFREPGSYFEFIQPECLGEKFEKIATYTDPTTTLTKIVAEISFVEPEAVAKQAVRKVLAQFSDRVESVVQRFA